MIDMARQPLIKPMQVRTNSRARLALRKVVAEMSDRPRLAFEGGRLTQEALISASWLWMEWIGPETLEAILAPHVDRLNAIVEGLPDPGVSPRIAEPPGGVVEGVRVTAHNDAAAETTARSDVQVERGGEAV